MPVVGVSAEKIEERASLFERIARDQVAAESFRLLDLELESDFFTIAGEAYCFLNEAYKRARLPNGSLTRPPKQGAISALAIGSTQPIQPGSSVDRKAIRQSAYLNVNSALALRTCCAACEISTDKWNTYTRIRFYRMVRYLKFPSLAPIFKEAAENNLKLKSHFEPNLSRDELAKIDAFVAYVELL